LPNLHPLLVKVVIGSIEFTSGLPWKEN